MIIAGIGYAYAEKPDPEISDGSLQTIKIGLLIPDNKSVAAVQGAEMAVRIANERAGPKGSHFQLIVRSMDGPWGTGSKQAVDLIFEEKVWALLGSHDGRNAHLVEQAATKSTVVFLSAWSGDPTLSQAFVPWFFNCVPNDNQQSASLIEEIYNKNKFRKIAVIYGSDYDSEMILNNFLKSVKKSGQADPFQFKFDKDKLKINDITKSIRETGAECIILFCQPAASLELVRQIRREKLDPPLYGSLMLFNENILSTQDLQFFDNLLSVPSGDWTGSENLNFRQEFQKTYKKIPGMAASFAFDGMNLLIEAVRVAGSPDREKIQKALEDISHKGVTGPIQFDDRGNRTGDFSLMKTKDGLPYNPE